MPSLDVEVYTFSWLDDSNSVLLYFLPRLSKVLCLSTATLFGQKMD